MPPTLVIVPCDPGAFEGAEPLIERLDQPEEALARLGELGMGTGVVAAGGGWWASVSVDGTPVLVAADAETWGIYAPVGADEADAMLAARRLHGLLGTMPGGWDLDR
jgi:hypothetical protein